MGWLSFNPSQASSLDGSSLPSQSEPGPSRLPCLPDTTTTDVTDPSSHSSSAQETTDLPWYLSPTSSTRDKLIPISGGLFAVSLGLTVLLSLRRYRRLEAKELAEAAKAAGAGEGEASSKGPGILRRSGHAGVPTASRVGTAPASLENLGRATRPGAARIASVPTALSSSSAPSTGAGLASLQARAAGKQGEADEDGKEEGPNPVLYTLKAFGIATAIVASTALLSLEVGKGVLGVGTMDELVHLLSLRIPHLVSSPRGVAERMAVSSRSMLDGKVPASVQGSQDPDDSPPPPTPLPSEQEAQSASPRATQEVFDDLGEAARKGEGWTWLSILDEQLVRERFRDERERRSRLGLDKEGQAHGA